MDSHVVEFQVADILPLALVIVVAGIGVSYGLDILGDIRDDQGEDYCADNTDGFTNWNVTAHNCYNSSGSTITPGSAEYNATLNSSTAVSKFTSKLGLIVTVIVAAILIGVLVTYMMVRFRR